jgi:hypothetical protein
VKAVISNRTARISTLLQQMWGGDLPPGERPFVTVAEDSTRVDDVEGRMDGVIVRGDGVRIEDILIILESDPGTEAAMRVANTLRLATH